MKCTESGRWGAVSSWLAMSASVLVLAACGGGDGTAAAPAPVASPPPPPPPASTNTAPVASITTDTATPDEGQPFMVDASSSSDPDDEDLTFMWTQTAGPDLEITDPTSPVQSFTAPELTETVTVSFEVEVSDGELSNTASVDVQLTNIFQLPRATFSPSLSQTISVPGIQKIFDMDDRDGIFIGLSGGQPNNQTLDFVTLFSGRSASLPSPVSNDAIIEDLSSSDNERPLVIIEESLDLARVFRIPDSFDAPLDYGLSTEFNFERPCGSFGGDFIGQRDRGFTVVTAISIFGTDPVTGVEILVPVEKIEVNTGQSLCAALPINASLRGIALDSGSGFTRPDVLAIDTDNLTVNLFRHSPEAQGPGEYNILDQMPVEVEAGLSLVSVDPIEQRGFLLVFTNGQHRGTHRAIVVGLDDNSDLIQQSYSWSIGAPVSASVGTVLGGSAPQQYMNQTK